MLAYPDSPKRATPTSPAPPRRSPPPIAPHLLDPELEQQPKQEDAITVIDASPAKHQPPTSYSPSANTGENRWNPPPPPPLPLSFTPAVFAVPYEVPMPHRVADRSSSRRSDDRQYEPSAQLDHSPAPSITSLPHSSISSPSPPLHPPPQQYYQSSSYSYNPPPPPPSRYHEPSVSHYSQSPHVAPGVPVTTRAIRPAYVPTQSYPGQANHIMYTDDSGTKLSDRVRRRCYNCRGTDTSTWRRSSLTPGKVLCNKCGLFERTHSVPRPATFPHKRGPIVTTSFKSTRTPPPSHQSRLPPISVPVPPHQYDHPSIAPLVNRSETQASHSPNGTSPELRNILNGPSSAMPDQKPLINGSLSGPAENGHARTPPSRTSPNQSPRVEQRTPPQT